MQATDKTIMPDPGTALHDALCNLNIKVRPGAAALLALTASDWNFSPAEADMMRATVEWIARRLVAELASFAAELDAGFLAAGVLS